MNLWLKLDGKIMKVFKKSKRHLSKHTKARPTIRRSVTKEKTLKLQELNAYGRMLRREMLAERRANRVKSLGLNLIKAMEWGYMRKRLALPHISSPAERLVERRKIADEWAERRQFYLTDLLEKENDI